MFPPECTLSLEYKGNKQGGGGTDQNGAHEYHEELPKGVQNLARIVVLRAHLRERSIHHDRDCVIEDALTKDQAVVSASISLKIASTATGSVEEIKAPKAQDSFRVKAGVRESAPNT